VNHAHHERPKILIQHDPAKYPVQPRQRRVVGRVRMGFGIVSMRMVMDVGRVTVGMRVDDFLSIMRVD
jgi:hypothetical protein